MKEQGITIVELTIVMSVFAMLIAGVGFAYQNWARGYEVERTIRELYADMMHARMRALARRHEHYAVLNGRSYSIVEDTNESGEFDGGDELLPGFPKTVPYTLSRNGSGNKITFNGKGLISGLRTIRVLSDADADYDCVKVSMSRIITGRYSGGECSAK